MRDTLDSHYVSAVSVQRGQADRLFVDVRTPAEFAAERIADSINIPLDKVEERSDEFPRNAKLMFICRTGKRADRAASLLSSKGFEPEVLEGGMIAWRQAGFPIIRGKSVLPLDRQVQLTVGIGVLAGLVLGTFVNYWFLIVPAFFGAGLVFAGATGTCGLAILLMKAPWNK